MVVKWFGAGVVAFAICAAGPSQATDWTAFYLGVIGGAGEFSALGPVTSQPMAAPSWNGGLFAGYTIDAGPFVLGPDVTILLGGESTQTIYTTFIGFEPVENTDTISRGPLLLVNGRAGVPFGDVLFSLTGGIAAAHVNFDRLGINRGSAPGDVWFDHAGSAMHVGYNVGASVEMKLGENVVAGIDLRHVDLGRITHHFDNGGRGEISASEQHVMIRVGARFP